jgi:hypothetical protein
MSELAIESAIEILKLEQVGMFALVLQNVLEKKIPCKKMADLHLNQGNLLHRNNFRTV